MRGVWLEGLVGFRSTTSTVIGFGHPAFPAFGREAHPMLRAVRIGAIWLHT